MQDMRLQDKEEKRKEKNYKEESQEEIEIIHPRISRLVSSIQHRATTYRDNLNVIFAAAPVSQYCNKTSPVILWFEIGCSKNVSIY